MYEITVAVCVYKQKHWLHRCLRSLMSQTLEKSRYEVVVVNDDPRENLDDVIDIFKEHINIRVINNKKNLGLPTSLNKILKTSMAKYFVRVDCDDYVSSHFLYVLSNFLKSNSGPRVMNTDCNYQAVACDYFKVNDTAELLSRHNSKDEFVACGIMYTYESLANLGFYNDSFKMREGHELNKRFLEEYKMYHLRMPLYRYRLHGENRTNDVEETEKYDNKLEKK
jgi:glycosyltransferase involved in cell wall biosynthesis